MSKELTMMERKYIVFGAEHYNPLGIVRSLGESGLEVDAVILKNIRLVTSKSKYITRLKIVNSIEEGYQYILKNYGKRQGIKDIIYTSDDQITNFLDMRYEDLKERFFFFNAGENGRISRFQNKDAINKLALKYGLNVLDSWVVNKGDVPSDISYPVITKALTSTIDNWKDEVYVCVNEEELIKAYAHIRSERILVQKYIKKKNELCLDGYSVAKGNDVVFNIASNYNYILPDTYSPYMTIFNFNNKKVSDSLKGMFSEIGFEGIFSVEFLVGERDELYFLEINFRNSTWSYASTRAGMPLPVLWAEGMISGHATRKVKKIPTGFTAMVEFDEYRNRVKCGKISLIKWLNDLRNARCRFCLGKKDPLPFLIIIFSKIKRKIRSGKE